MREYIYKYIIFVLVLSFLGCSNNLNNNYADIDFEADEEYETKADKLYDPEIDEQVESFENERAEKIEQQCAGKPIAIYDDTQNNDASAWAEGLDLIENICKTNNLCNVRISRDQLNGSLHLSDFGAIVFGGGFAYPGYTIKITNDAKQKIRNYIEGGGTFVGICAGAYFACDVVVYETEEFDDEDGYNLNLFPGKCIGPIESISTYPNWNTALIKFESSHIFTTVCKDGCNMWFWYAGGPWFVVDDTNGSTKVFGTYMEESTRGNAAVIRHKFGLGNVWLWGIHPEATWYGSTPSTPYMLADILKQAALTNSLKSERKTTKCP